MNDKRSGSKGDQVEFVGVFLFSNPLEHVPSTGEMKYRNYYRGLCVAVGKYWIDAVPSHIAVLQCGHG